MHASFFFPSNLLFHTCTHEAWCTLKMPLDGSPFSDQVDTSSVCVSNAMLSTAHNFTRTMQTTEAGKFSNNRVGAQLDEMVETG